MSKHLFESTLKNTVYKPQIAWFKGVTETQQTMETETMFKVIQISKKTGTQADVMAYHSFAKAMAHLEYIQAKPFLTKYTDYAIVLA